MARYSAARKTFTVSFTVDSRVTEWDVKDALQRCASQASHMHAVTVSDITIDNVTETDREVTITESEYTAFLAAAGKTIAVSSE